MLFDGEISTETIMFQSDTEFLTGINFIHEQILTLIEESSQNINIGNTLQKKIEDIVYKRFGIRIKLIRGIGIGPFAAITVPTAFEGYQHAGGNNPYHYPEEYRGLVREIEKNISSSVDKLRGKSYEVDLEAARIHGLENVVAGLIAMDYENLASWSNGHKITPQELTAILLHELGHIFSFLEYNSRAKKRLSTFQEVLSKYKSDPKAAKKIVIANSREISNEKEFRKKIKEYKDNDVVFWSYYVNKHLESLWKQQYDIENLKMYSEIMADQFAARFGLSKELVVVLEKIESVNRNTLVIFIKVYNNFLVLRLFFHYLTLLLPAFPAFVIALFLTRTILGSRGIFRDYVYPVPEDRARRIISEFIASVNMDKTIPKDVRNKILEDYDIMRNIEKKKRLRATISKFLDFFNIDIAYLFSVSKRAHIKTTQVEQIIDDLVANNLKISALRIDKKLD